MNPQVELRRDAYTRGERRRVLRGLIGLALVTLLLAAMAGLFEDPEARSKEELRSSYARRGDGYYGLVAVLDTLQIRHRRMRKTYGALHGPEEHVLCSLDPVASFLRHRAEGEARLDTAQIRALRNFVQLGGVLFGSLPGENHWMRATLPRLEQGLEVRFEEPLLALFESGAPETTFVPASGRITPAGGVEFAELDLEVSTAASWVLRAFVRETDAPDNPLLGTERPRLQVFRKDLPADCQVEARFNDHPLLISKPMGLGRVYLCASSLPFSNYALARLDTGPMVVSWLMDAAEQGARGILIDEYCHGFGQERGVWWYAMHSGLRYPLLGILALVSLLAWRGMFRLGTARPVLRVPRRAVEEYVVSLADLSLRANCHRDAAWCILREYASRLRLNEVQRDGEAWPVALRGLAAELQKTSVLDAEGLRDFVRRSEAAFVAAGSGGQMSTVS